MIEVKTSCGRISLKVSGSVDVIAADVTLLLHTIYENLRNDEERAFFRKCLEQDVGEDGLAWVSQEELDERFRQTVHAELDKALSMIFGPDTAERREEFRRKMEQAVKDYANSKGAPDISFDNQTVREDESRS